MRNETSTSSSTRPCTRSCSMMFSTTCTYALQAMCGLAAIRSQGYASMQEICAGTDLPDQFIAKIMRSLTKAELLTSARGRNGGFALAREPGSISLYDIVEVIDGVQQYTGCVLGLSICDDKQPCSQHEHVKPVRRQVLSYLKNTTLDAMSEALAEKQQLIRRVQKGLLDG